MKWGVDTNVVDHEGRDVYEAYLGGESFDEDLEGFYKSLNCGYNAEMDHADSLSSLVSLLDLPDSFKEHVQAIIVESCCSGNISLQAIYRAVMQLSGKRKFHRKRIGAPLLKRLIDDDSSWTAMDAKIIALLAGNNGNIYFPANSLMSKTHRFPDENICADFISVIQSFYKHNELPLELIISLPSELYFTASGQHTSFARYFYEQDIMGLWSALLEKYKKNARCPALKTLTHIFREYNLGQFKNNLPQMTKDLKARGENGLMDLIVILLPYDLEQARRYSLKLKKENHKQEFACLYKAEQRGVVINE